MPIEENTKCEICEKAMYIEHCDEYKSNGIMCECVTCESQFMPNLLRNVCQKCNIE